MSRLEKSPESDKLTASEILSTPEGLICLGLLEVGDRFQLPSGSCGEVIPPPFLSHDVEVMLDGENPAEFSPALLVRKVRRRA